MQILTQTYQNCFGGRECGGGGDGGGGVGKRMLTYADVCCMLRSASEDESAAVVETEEEALVCVLSYRIALALVNAGAYVRIRPHTSAYVSMRSCPIVSR